jgi:hypothetical protein
VAGPASPHVNVDRRSMLLAASAIVATAATLRSTDTKAQTSVPLASWNEGPAKQAILDFVSATTDQSSKAFVSPEGRSATFDQDGTLWTEHPLYAQAAFALYRVHELAPQHPEWQTRSHSSRRYPTIWRLWANSPNAIGSRSSLPPLRDEPDAFGDIVAQWLAAAKDPRFKRRYTDLVQRFDEATPMGGGCEVSGATQNTVDAIGAVSRDRSTSLSADVRSDGVSTRQSIQNLLRYRRRAGVRACLCAARVWRPARAGCGVA